MVMQGEILAEQLRNFCVAYYDIEKRVYRLNAVKFCAASGIPINLLADYYTYMFSDDISKEAAERFITNYMYYLMSGENFDTRYWEWSENDRDSGDE